MGACELTNKRQINKTKDKIYSYLYRRARKKWFSEHLDVGAYLPT